MTMQDFFVVLFVHLYLLFRRVGVNMWGWRCSIPSSTDSLSFHDVLELRLRKVIRIFLADLDLFC